MIRDEDLRSIWQSADAKPSAEIDFEKIKSQAKKSGEKLRRKIKWDIGLNLAGYVLFAPLVVAYPRILVSVPVVIAVWAWYLFEILRIYRAENDFHRFADTRELLATRQTMLKSYLRRTRFVGWLLVPTIYLMSLWVYEAADRIWSSPLAVFLGMFAFAVPVVVFVEVYIRYFYTAELDELADLLQQLDDTSEAA